MGKRGTKRTPTKILKDRGSTKIGDREGEPVPDSAFPEMPSGFNEYETEQWDSLCKSLKRMGLLTKTDTNAMSRYCVLYVKFLIAIAYTGVNGDWYTQKTRDGSSPKMHPAAQMVLKLSGELNRLEAQFGLTPSARANINIEKAIPQKVDTERFFNRAGLKKAN